MNINPLDPFAGFAFMLLGGAGFMAVAYSILALNKERPFAHAAGFILAIASVMWGLTFL